MSSDSLPSDSLETNTKFSFDKDQAVTLIVGPSKHEMLAHSEFLSLESDYFKAALKKEWAEGQTRTVTFVDECPRIMSHYLHYVYTKKLPTAVYVRSAVGDFFDICNSLYETLAELYVLGERFLNIPVRAAVIRELLRLATLTDADENYRYPAAVAVNIIYSGTATASPARRLLVDMYLTYGYSEWLNHSFNAVFLLDIAQGLYTNNEKGLTFASVRSQKLRKENYHI